eukprot:CAMPEP_0115395884 /NCGR_PEP_ID=MMETSP0271-20121206/13012_1 /TAXON_ID=71861 /ORGANISM="Scrippsiella trochoidea, Strain CCMP3099" /LENGTH=30 /DNA_ID= /DNA_START= /DNA_END= /DNA_ORIENTATION=
MSIQQALDDAVATHGSQPEQMPYERHEVNQ